MNDRLPVLFLSLEHLIGLADGLQVGPVRDIGLLESVARRPQTQRSGGLAYPTLPLMAAALLESIVRNHPL